MLTDDGADPLLAGPDPEVLARVAEMEEFCDPERWATTSRGNLMRWWGGMRVVVYRVRVRGGEKWGYTIDTDDGVTRGAELYDEAGDATFAAWMLMTEGGV